MSNGFKSDEHVCVLCNGRGGAFNDDGTHFLCAARSRREAPTPSLGDVCRDCSGNGFTFPENWSVIDPTQRQIDAAKRPCLTCNGSGSTTPPAPTDEPSADEYIDLYGWRESDVAEHRAKVEAECNA